MWAQSLPNQILFTTFWCLEHSCSIGTAVPLPCGAVVAQCLLGAVRVTLLLPGLHGRTRSQGAGVGVSLGWQWHSQAMGNAGDACPAPRGSAGSVSALEVSPHTHVTLCLIKLTENSWSHLVCLHTALAPGSSSGEQELCPLPLQCLPFSCREQEGRRKL